MGSPINEHPTSNQVNCEVVPVWALEDVPWDQFDPDKVDPDILRAVKAAAMVEFNSPDYVAYLCNVFADREDVKQMVRQWGVEEAQHGRALAQWAAMADPDFDFEASFKRFRAGYRVPIEVETSTRGSRAGEMIARCVVESATSSFYTAIKDAADEPVLKHIAGLIAADEFRHYKLFYDLFGQLHEEVPSKLARARIAYGRVSETDDDELAYAYYAANIAPEVAYERTRYAAAYERRALTLYDRKHTDRLVSMIAKAVGINPRGFLVRSLTPLVWRVWQVKLRRAAALAA